MNKKHLLIFTDASFNPRTRTGISGYLLLLVSKGSSITKDISLLPVKTKLFRKTNCTRLELTSIILALDASKKLTRNKVSEQAGHLEITVYTDCKTAYDLPSRRIRLEKRNFKSMRTRKPLANADLYLKFFKLFDELRPSIIWVKGHKSAKSRDHIDMIFSHVDRTTRRILRECQ